MTRTATVNLPRRAMTSGSVTFTNTDGRQYVVKFEAGESSKSVADKLVAMLDKQEKLTG